MIKKIIGVIVIFASICGIVYFGIWTFILQEIIRMYITITTPDYLTKEQFIRKLVNIIIVGPAISYISILLIIKPWFNYIRSKKKES